MNSYIYALGVFDGVHVGHQALLRECRRLSQLHGATPGIITFASHPDTLVLGKAPLLLNTPADRERLLRRFGMERIERLPFDRAMQDTPWQEFLTRLRRDYGAVGFVCGEDFIFGRRGAGTAASLAEYCQQEGLPHAVVPEQYLRGVRVSSTYIRSLFEAGDLEAATLFLGHPHILSGLVIHGKQLGRTLGIPTANLPMPEGLVLPRFGVYACRAWVDGKPYCAVTNVGTRPTVAGKNITVEPGLLDYEGDLYGRELTLEFHKFVRPERKFESLPELQAEIRRNAQQTREFFSKEPYPTKPAF